MNTQPCLSVLKNRYLSLTNAEKKIADYVLEHPETVISATITSLAESSGVAPSAINRFCKTLEYEGFRDFKLSLARELGTRISSPEDVLPAVHRDDSVSDVFEKVFQSGMRTLQNTQRMLDMNTLDEIISLLDNAGRIFIFGVGTSATIASDAQYRLMQLGYNAVCSSDILYMQVNAMQLGPGDVALAVSHSGETRATIDTLRLARERGAAAIALSSYGKSSLCMLADHSIVAYSDDQTYPVEAVSARIAHICTLDAIMLALFVRRYDSAAKHIKDRNQALKEIRSK